MKNNIVKNEIDSYFDSMCITLECYLVNNIITTYNLIDNIDDEFKEEINKLFI